MRYDMILTGPGSASVHPDFPAFADALAKRLRADPPRLSDNRRRADIRGGRHGRVAPGIAATAPDEFTVIIDSDWSDDAEHNAFGDVVHAATADVLPGVRVILLNPVDDAPLRTVVRHRPSAA